MNMIKNNPDCADVLAAAGTVLTKGDARLPDSAAGSKPLLIPIYDLPAHDAARILAVILPNGTEKRMPHFVNRSACQYLIFGVRFSPFADPYYFSFGIEINLVKFNGIVRFHGVRRIGWRVVIVEIKRAELVALVGKFSAISYNRFLPHRDLFIYALFEIIIERVRVNKCLKVFVGLFCR